MFPLYMVVQMDLNYPCLVEEIFFYLNFGAVRIGNILFLVAL